MARVICRITDVEAGDLPAICAKTGVECANPVGVRLRAGFRSIRGVLPIVASRVRLVRVLVKLSWVVLALAAILLFASVRIGVAGVLIYLLLFLAGDRLWVGTRPVASADEIMLTRVHRNFAAAVDAQYGRN